MPDAFPSFFDKEREQKKVQEIPWNQLESYFFPFINASNIVDTFYGNKSFNFTMENLYIHAKFKGPVIVYLHPNHASWLQPTCCLQNKSQTKQEISHKYVTEEFNTIVRINCALD